MPPKKRQRSNDMPVLPYTVYPQNNNPGWYNYNQVDPNQQQQHQHQQQLYQHQINQSPVHYEESDVTHGAILLNGLKDNGESLRLKKNKGAKQRIFIHRITKSLDDLVITFPESGSRNDEEISNGYKIEQDNDVGLVNEDLGSPATKHSNADIIFANGNNREKRRVEMFENYSELYKYKEAQREKLYKQQRQILVQKIKELSTPHNFNTAIPDETKNLIFEQEMDLVEARDFELTRLKYWRNYRRNENLKNYYKQSVEIYQDANKVLINKLEKLKIFFNKQKNLLVNLDREYTDINSNRAEKFYTGFQSHSKSQSPEPQSQQQQQQVQEDTDHLSIPEPDHGSATSSETDVGFTSANSTSRTSTIKSRGVGGGGKKRSRPSTSDKSSKLNNTLMSSIQEGFAPILTHEEFTILTTDDSRKPIQPSSITSSSKKGSSPHNSETDQPSNQGTSGSRGGRTTTSSRAVREARDREGYGAKDSHTAMLNRIMKQYVAPDALAEIDVEDDLKILRK